MKGALKWAVNEVRELPTYVSGRVALLGDAVSCQPASLVLHTDLVL
jgi:2-polyprenyl-6-methoxyphenol hydroxylase-like FAD-dependent oxidoreductase